MENLTTKQEEMMELFWVKGPMFVNEIQDSCNNRETLHPSTITTLTHKLEKKGYLGHLVYGRHFQYYPIVMDSSILSALMKRMKSTGRIIFPQT